MTTPETTAPDTVRLEPCPFCNDPMAWRSDLQVTFGHSNPDTSPCPLGNVTFFDKDVEAWNTRPLSLPQGEEVERRELYIEFDGEEPIAAVYRENRREVMRCSIQCERAALASMSPTLPPKDEGLFQQRVQPWLMECFGAEICTDRIERNHRFLEEALELVQSNGCTRDEARQLVEYVYDRSVGELNQEVGGVMVTLAALCLASGVDMHAAGETELARIWTKVEQIRAKQAAKPKHSPLPAAPARPALSPSIVEKALPAFERVIRLADTWAGGLTPVQSQARLHIVEAYKALSLLSAGVEKGSGE